MAFFDPDLSEILHVAAVPMEGLGLILTITEVFYRDKARAIEKSLHRFSTSSFGDLYRAYRIARGEDLDYPLSESLPTWVTWAVGVAAGLAAGVIGLIEHSWGIAIAAFFVALFSLFYVVVPLGLFTLSRVIKPFSVLTGHHALGGFGLLLGTIGFLTELYLATPIVLRSLGF
jgi:hypothetical protein